MSRSRHHARLGGKFGGTHTTFISVAVMAAGIAASSDAVYNIAAGIIVMSRAKSSSRRHVKIIDDAGGILLSVSEGSAHQEVRVYVSDVHAAKLHIAKGCRDNDLTISFGKKI